MRTVLIAAAAGWVSGSGAAAQTSDPNVGTEPAPQSRAAYIHLVERQARSAQDQPVELLFVGDSITASWMRSSPQPWADNRAVWDRWYGDRHAFEMGIGGDQTQNVLWRLPRELDGLHPRLVVLLIGTNNLGFHQTPAQTERGVDQVVADLHARLPAAHILVLGILPRTPERLGVEAGQVNALLARDAAQWPFATFEDVGSVLLKDGAPDPALYMESRQPNARRLLHPNAFGAERIARAIEPEVAHALGDRNKLQTP